MAVHPVTRRTFLGTAGAAACAGVASESKAATTREDSPIRVGIMGLSRGLALARNFAAIPGVEVRYVCDVDSRRAEAAVKAVTDVQVEKKNLSLIHI